MHRILLATSITAVAACSSDSSGPGNLAPNEVAVLDNRFDPAQLSVFEGDTVIWLWRGDNLHAVAFDTPGYTGSAAQQAGSFSAPFPEAGIVSYYCPIHGRNVMAGQITVQRSSGPNEGEPGN